MTNKELFNKELFTKTVNLLAARLLANKINPIRKEIRDHILSFPRVKTVVNDPDDEAKRLLLLSESFQNEKDIPDSVRSVIESNQAEIVPYILKLGYDYYTAEEVLRRLLPEEVDVPSSFETVGHIAHMNLREEQEPFKHIIGQVILDKSPAIRTVVNKVGTIDSTFRFFAMEVLAGEPETVVQVKEEGCRFEFDYAKVYWNSRLQFEHRRLVSLFAPGQLICDVFCGVGPFALPSAKKGCRVYANDLNPESVKWLKHNAELNKLGEGKLLVHNMDGRDFIRESLKILRSSLKDETVGFDHYVMNLPAIAYQFLDAIAEIESSLAKPTRIHCYTFVKPDGDAIDNIEAGLGQPINKDTTVVKHVRTVAPNKDMYCVSFTFPVPSKRQKQQDI